MQIFDVSSHCALSVPSSSSSSFVFLIYNSANWFSQLGSGGCCSGLVPRICLERCNGSKLHGARGPNSGSLWHRPHARLTLSLSLCLLFPPALSVFSCNFKWNLIAKFAGEPIRRGARGASIVGTIFFFFSQLQPLKPQEKSDVARAIHKT